MNFRLGILFILLTAIYPVVWSQPGTVVDKIVAQVGNNIILLSDIQQQKLQALQANMTPDRNMECQILEELMYQELLLNQAQLDSLVVSDEQVDAEMENRIRVIENQIGGRQKMEEFYGKTITQIKDEFREIIRNKLLAEDMERKITENLSITPKDVKAFYNDLPADSIPYINAKMGFQQIVIYPEITDADKKAAFDKLEDIRQQIFKGKSFASMARIHSEDPGSASQGGVLEATRGMMVPPFEAAAFKLANGEISEVFESEYGYHIIQMIERKGDNYRCAHILVIPTYSDQSLEKAAYRMDSCYAELKAGTITWDEAVIKYSNDDATKQNRGIITNPYTLEQAWDTEDLNQIDQQIYLLTDRLKVGEYTKPSLYTNFFERKEGVRIVRLMSRKPQHKANLKDDYALIKTAAENDKRQKMVDAWITSKMKNAFIRIDEDWRDCNFRNDWNSIQ